MFGCQEFGPSQLKHKKTSMKRDEKHLPKRMLESSSSGKINSEFLKKEMRKDEDLLRKERNNGGKRKIGPVKRRQKRNEGDLKSKQLLRRLNEEQRRKLSDGGERG